MAQYRLAALTGLARKVGFSLDTPIRDLPKKAVDAILHGTPDPLKLSYENRSGQRRSYEIEWEGVIPRLEQDHRETTSEHIRQRLGFLVDVGLDYLTLDRSANTLSGGEAQRIRLATQIGSSLMGVLYILDEPSIGLHQRDNARLIRTLLRLRDLGNTLIVVEHDEEMMRAADWIIDVGPGAGVHGGRIVAAGKIQDLARQPRSITGQYLSGERQIVTPEKRRTGNGKSLTLYGAKENNLKNVTVRFP